MRCLTYDQFEYLWKLCKPYWSLPRKGNVARRRKHGGIQYLYATLKRVTNSHTFESLEDSFGISKTGINNDFHRMLKIVNYVLRDFMALLSHEERAEVEGSIPAFPQAIYILGMFKS